MKQTSRLQFSKLTGKKTWTLEQEAGDIVLQIEAERKNQGFALNAETQPFLGHLDDKGKNRFIEHLQAGRLRAAFGMIAHGAFLCGVRDGQKMLAGRKARIVERPEHPNQLATVELQEVSTPEISAKLEHCRTVGMTRAQTMATLRDAGVSKRQADSMTRAWKLRGKRGRHSKE